MTVKKTHWLRTSIIILLIFGIVGLALTSVMFFSNPGPTYASATLEFTFEGAANGTAPNGASFSISEIASEDVLSAALEQASLNDTYSVEQIQDSVVARGVYPKDIADQVMSFVSMLDFTVNQQATLTEFHPTTFDIQLHNDFDPSISRGQLEALLQAIVSSYRSYFALNYASGLQKGNMLFTLEDYDYPQRLEIIGGHFSTLANYAMEMYDRHPTFRYEGSNFNDIRVRLNNLISSDIARLNADLTVNALAQDSDRLMTQYRFEIRDLSNQLEKKTAQLENMDALIASYDKNGVIYYSVADTLTKIDGNSSETYNTLVDQRKVIADNIAVINSRISDYQFKLLDLQEHSQPQATPTDTDADPEAEATSAISSEAIQPDPDRAALLEKEIEALVEKGDVIIDDFQDMLQAYNDRQISDQTISVVKYDYERPSILSGTFIMLAIMTAGPFCAVGFMLCLMLIIRSRKRENLRRR